MNLDARAEFQRRLDDIRKVLTEEGEFARRQKKHDEIEEGIRQLEGALSKLESDERARLLSLQSRLEKKQQQSGLIDDLAKDRRAAMRRVAKLKKLRREQQTVTGQGLQMKARAECLEDELNWLGKTGVSADTLFVEGRKANLKKTLEQTREEIDALRQRYAELDDSIREMAAAEKELFLIEQKLAEARRAHVESEALQDEIAKQKAHVSRRYYARREIAALENLKKNLADNAYDADQHERLRRRIFEFVERDLKNFMQADG